MPVELNASVARAYSFLLVLARVSGVVALVPLPGIQSGPRPARIVLALAVTLALCRPTGRESTRRGRMRRACCCGYCRKLAVGIAIGLGVAFILEVFLMAAQVLSLQCRLQLCANHRSHHPGRIGRVAGLRATGRRAAVLRPGVRPRDPARLSRAAWKASGRSLRTHAAGGGNCCAGGDGMLALALRLALPMIALLAMVDISLGLLGRVNAQLQLLTLAFP